MKYHPFQYGSLKTENDILVHFLEILTVIPTWQYFYQLKICLQQ